MFSIFLKHPCFKNVALYLFFLLARLGGQLFGLLMVVAATVASAVASVAVVVAAAAAVAAAFFCCRLDECREGAVAVR